jgi:hypothetical protein
MSSMLVAPSWAKLGVGAIASINAFADSTPVDKSFHFISASPARRPRRLTVPFTIPSLTDRLVNN